MTRPRAITLKYIRVCGGGGGGGIVDCSKCPRKKMEYIPVSWLLFVGWCQCSGLFSLVRKHTSRTVCSLLPLSLLAF